MRSSYALTAIRRIGMVSSRRAAPHCSTFLKAMSTKSRYSSNVEIVEEVNRPEPDLRKEAFAVDAPDGETDAHLKEEMEEVNKTISETARIENSPEFQKTQAEMRKTFAVDGPDGEPDAHFEEERLEANHTIDETARIENSEEFKKMQAEFNKTVAVDAPDGETDGHLQEEMEEVNKIIDSAAAHEDKAQVEADHRVEKAVREESERHPEHDW